MQNEKYKSFSELSILKEIIKEGHVDDVKPANLGPTKTIVTAQKYQHLSDSERSKWGPVFDLIEDPLFQKIVNGSVRNISSKKYSLVTAVLTYPSTADLLISQEDLDRAHGIAYLIKSGVNSGNIKYTKARIPSTWRIAGNPGTKR